MSSQANTVAVRSGVNAIVPQSIQELLQVADIYYKSGLKPKGCTRPEDVAAIILAGLEAGLRPGQALNCMYLVNGKAVIYGDMPLALVRASGLLESIDERVEGTGDDRAGVCTMHRKGDPAPRTQRYSLGEARRAGLLMKGGKPGPWDLYTDRMLLLRPRGWLIRDLFGDVLAGLALAEDQDAGASTTIGQVTPPVTDSTNLSEPPTDVHGELMIDEAQLAEVKRLAPTWMKLNSSQGAPNDEMVGAWRRLLESQWGVVDARKLTSSQAETLLVILRETAGTPQAALFAPPSESAATANGASQPTTQHQAA